jgi:hypothetical protein
VQQCQHQQQRGDSDGLQDTSHTTPPMRKERACCAATATTADQCAPLTSCWAPATPPLPGLAPCSRALRKLMATAATATAALLLRLLLLPRGA